jgi:hypothetical protein
MSDKNGKSKSSIEVYVPPGGFEFIESKRGQQRYELITLGSWWARKEKQKDGGGWADAFRIEEIIPSLPMNRVRLSRVRAPSISVNALVNAWYPVKVMVQPSTRDMAPAKKPSTRSTIEQLQAEVDTLRAEFDELRKALGA